MSTSDKTKGEPPTLDLASILKQMMLEDGEGASVRELAKKVGMRKNWVLTRLRAMYDKGEVIVATREAFDMIGRSYREPVYKLKEVSDVRVSSNTDS